MNTNANPHLRRMQADDLEQVLSWRNHVDVRRYMYTQHEITFEEHSQWFTRASQDSNKHLLIFEIERVPLGFINIHQVAEGGIADWGFYAAPKSPKGTGKALGLAALKYAFEDIGLHKLCGQALGHNERSMKFHKSLGFKAEGVLRQQHFDGQNYHDIHCFGILASDWQQLHS